MNLSMKVEFPKYVQPGVVFETKISVKNDSIDSGQFWVNYSVDGRIIALLEEVPIGPNEEVLWVDHFDIDWWTLYEPVPARGYVMMRFLGGPMGDPLDDDPLDNGPETMGTDTFKVTYGTASKSSVPWGTIAAIAGGVTALGVAAKKGK